MYKEMIANLMQITADRVYQHVASEASMMVCIAQRVDPKLKIKTPIEYAHHSPHATFFEQRQHDTLQMLSAQPKPDVCVSTRCPSQL
jgi:hypothetical protein